MSKKSIMRNESIGRESGKTVKKLRKYWRIYMLNLYEKSTWNYMKLHGSMKNLHIEYMQQKKEKNSESTWKIEKSKIACWVWNKWKCTYWKDAILSYSNSPKSIGHNLAVIFALFLFFKICLVIPGQELLEIFQHAIALKEEAQLKTKWWNSTRTKRLFLA